MNIVKIEQKIRIVQDSDIIKISIVVPALNIEKMKQLLGCRILGKEPFPLRFNHTAGKTFKVQIYVQASKILPYLRTEHYADATNAAAYRDLLNKPASSLYYSEYMVKCEKVDLYAFGQCSGYCAEYARRRKPNTLAMNVLYYGKDGTKISLHRTGDIGNRYINFRGQWLTNKSF